MTMRMHKSSDKAVDDVSTLLMIPKGEKLYKEEDEKPKPGSKPQC